MGLLPDFFADLEALQVPIDDLEPLFTSAEGYVRMWEKAQKASAHVPLPPIRVPPLCPVNEKCCETDAKGKCTLCLPMKESCR